MTSSLDVSFDVDLAVIAAATFGPLIINELTKPAPPAISRGEKAANRAAKGDSEAAEESGLEDLTEAAA